MKVVYSIFAYLIALGVAVQSASAVYGMAGLGKWVSDGGVLDQAAFENDTTEFSGLGGLVLHGINGTMVIPALAIVLLIVSFFAKVPHGVRWAGIVLGLVALQIALGIFGHSVIALGALHGMNALVLLGAAVWAGTKGLRAAGRMRGAADTGTGADLPERIDDPDADRRHEPL